VLWLVGPVAAPLVTKVQSVQGMVNGGGAGIGNLSASRA